MAKWLNQNYSTAFRTWIQVLRTQILSFPLCYFLKDYFGKHNCQLNRKLNQTQYIYSQTSLSCALALLSFDFTVERGLKNQENTCLQILFFPQIWSINPMKSHILTWPDFSSEHFPFPFLPFAFQNFPPIITSVWLLPRPFLFASLSSLPDVLSLQWVALCPPPLVLPSGIPSS